MSTTDHGLLQKSEQKKGMAAYYSKKFMLIPIKYNSMILSSQGDTKASAILVMYNAYQDAMAKIQRNP